MYAPKMRRIRSVYSCKCSWCERWVRHGEHARLRPYWRTLVCESCYVTERKHVARERKLERDQQIRNEDYYARQAHYWKLLERRKAMRPDPWRDYVRTAFTRILLNAARAIEDEWEREALAGYYALGMEVRA